MGDSSAEVKIITLLGLQRAVACLGAASLANSVEAAASLEAPTSRQATQAQVGVYSAPPLAGLDSVDNQPDSRA